MDNAPPPEPAPPSAAPPSAAPPAEPPCAADCLVAAALKVLTQPDPWRKADFSDVAVALWRSGAIAEVAPADAAGRAALRAAVPDRPARADDKARARCTWPSSTAPARPAAV